MVLLVLALIWAAALLPPFIRSRLDRSPVDSVGRFRRHLRILQSTSPAASALASAPDSTPSEFMPTQWATEAHRMRGMRRRRQVAASLLVTMGVTLLLGLLPPLRPLLFVHLLADIAFVGYLMMLARIRAIETERQMIAHFTNVRAEASAQAEETTAEHAVIDAAL